MSIAFETWLIVLILAGITLRILLRRRRRRWRLRRRAAPIRHQHDRNVRAARRVFSTLNGWTGDHLLPRVLAYLRKVDPYVFEELIMTALEAQGLSIRRNRRYSGDGGIDGRFLRDGALYLIQAKRYQGPINARHVRALGEAVARCGARGGIFVHTGSTPPGGYRQLARYQNVTLLSGHELVDLMQGKPLRLFRAGGRASQG